MNDTAGLIGTYRRFYEGPADVALGEGGAWFHRTQNMISAYVAGPAGTVYVRGANPDETFIWALFHPVTVTVGGSGPVEVAAASLVIVPPGDFEVALPDGGSMWLGFTSLATDLLDLCPNKSEYEPPLDNVAPVVPWPEPVGGYQLRVYDLTAIPAGKPHCYRHRTAMTNLGWPPNTAPRDQSALSPHNHDDFEQASLIHAGTFIHHMRREWSRNANEWMPDEHIVISAPGLAISKPPDLHTTQPVSTGGYVGLIDYFAPPRWDFSNVEGMVVNADEYPMPDEQPTSYKRVTTVYAATDPRSAIERKK